MMSASTLLVLGLLAAPSVVVASPTPPPPPGLARTPLPPPPAGMDETREPGAAGAVVVDSVVRLLDDACVFPEDARFLRRLAYVETADGTADKTYTDDYDGGIWQVRDIMTSPLISLNRSVPSR